MDAGFIAVVSVDKMLTVVTPKHHPPCSAGWARGRGLLSSIIKNLPARTDCSSGFHPSSPCWRRQGTADEAGLAVHSLGPCHRVCEFRASGEEQVGPAEPGEAP